ncbi:MAG TPA: hypothetical protein VN782_03105 [Usitatibacter sp.]|nr:hypothetical protein [Usitatibacter sp.]
MLTQSVREMREIARAYGPAALLNDLAWRAVNKLADFQVLRGMTVRLVDVRDPGLFDAAGYEAGFAGAQALLPFAGAAHEFSEPFLRRAFARGDRCYALFDRGRLASYGWYSTRPTSIDEHFELHFDSRYCYMYKGFTAPAYRGRRLHAIGMCRALAAVSDEGRLGLISYVYSNNFASLRSVERMGYRIFGTVYALRVGSMLATHATARCREYGFRLEKRAQTEHGMAAAAGMKKG